MRKLLTHRTLLFQIFNHLKSVLQFTLEPILGWANFHVAGKLPKLSLFAATPPGQGYQSCRVRLGRNLEVELMTIIAGNQKAQSSFTNNFFFSF